MSLFRLIESILPVGRFLCNYRQTCINGYVFVTKCYHPLHGDWFRSEISILTPQAFLRKKFNLSFEISQYIGVRVPNFFAQEPSKAQNQFSTHFMKKSMKYD